MSLIAVGVPVLSEPSMDWNFWPFLGIPLVLLISLRWFGFPRRIGVVLGGIVAGLLFADAVGAWGVIPGLTFLAALLGAAVVARGALRRVGNSQV
jgi:hypothetical protein